MVFETGPYLKGAFFCEKVLREADGVVSAIRIIDRLIISSAGPQAPKTMPELPHQMNALIMLTSGQARATCEIKIVPEEPSGLEKEPYIQSAFLEGEDKGANLLINLRTIFKEPGLYWYKVYCNDSLMTKMPFRVIYGRTSAGSIKADK